MKKLSLVYVIISIIVAFAIYFVVSTLYKGDYISEEYYFEGNSENWSISAKVLETGDETYSLTTKITYLAEGEAPERVEWFLKGNRFGTGGEESLVEGSLVKREQLRDMAIRNDEKITFSIKWNNQLEDNIFLTPKTDK